jgi:mono/diheme cytochrome c family protein
VLKGKGDMPAWGDILLEEEIDALWRYVATRGGKEPFPEVAETGDGGDGS